MSTTTDSASAWYARPATSGLKGSPLIAWYAFWKLLTNPFSLGFAVFLPIFMYVMFGVGQSYSGLWTGHANVAATVLVNMAVYGSIMTTSSMGANVALERTSGVSRLYALTPISPLALTVARIVASLAISAVVITVTFTIGYATGARMEPMAWLTAGAMIIVVSALPACIGLAFAFAVRSDGAFAGTSAMTVVAAFASGMFIPLNQMGEFFQTVAPWTPFYGLVQMVQLPLYGWSEFKWGWVGGYLAWSVVFIAIAVWAQRRDTGR